MRWTVRTLCMVALVACACAGGSEDDARDPAGADPASAPIGAPGASVSGVALVDSIPWENELTRGVDHRVAVRIGSVVDTLSGITTAREPVIVGDSAVTGFDRVGGSIARGFWYDATDRSIEAVPLPDDFLAFTAFAIAPDGRHLAYVGQADDGVRLVPSVRGWPSGAATWTGPAAEGYPSDARNSSVTWIAPDSVVIRIRLDALDTGRDLWMRAIVDPAGAAVVDTLDVGVLGSQ